MPNDSCHCHPSALSWLVRMDVLWILTHPDKDFHHSSSTVPSPRDTPAHHAVPGNRICICSASPHHTSHYIPSSVSSHSMIHPLKHMQIHNVGDVIFLMLTYCSRICTWYDLLSNSLWVVKNGMIMLQNQSKMGGNQHGCYEHTWTRVVSTVLPVSTLPLAWFAVIQRLHTGPPPTLTSSTTTHITSFPTGPLQPIAVNFVAINDRESMARKCILSCLALLWLKKSEVSKSHSGE